MERNCRLSDQACAPALQLATLSKRERVVAAKFATGMTHREVGAALFIAPATVRTHLAAVYRKLGVRSKGGLARLLAWDAEDDPAPARPRPGDGPERAAGPPVLAVLAFDNLTGEARWERLAGGLAADLITDLARDPDLVMLARHATLRYAGGAAAAGEVGRDLGAAYVLEGTIQAAGDRLRVTAQLTDCRSAAELWSARFDRPQRELFAIQDEVRDSVVSALCTCSGKLNRARREAARRKPPASLGAYDLYLLGVEQKHRFTRDGCAEAIRLLTRAVELDPGLARAWITLGLAHLVAALNGFSEQPAAAAVSRWRDCARRAVELDPSDFVARACIGDIRAQDGDHAGAVAEYELALASAPNHADTLALVAGSFALCAGDPRRGMELARRAVRLNPGAPPWYFAMLGRAELVAGNYREAVAALRRGPQDAPATLLLLAGAHALLGEADEAARNVARIRREFPAFTPDDFIRGYPVTNPPTLATIRAGIAAAGLPAPPAAAGPPDAPCAAPASW